MSNTWEWKNYDDGSGGLRKPDGSSFFSYDITTKEYMFASDANPGFYNDGNWEYYGDREQFNLKKFAEIAAVNDSINKAFEVSKSFVSIKASKRGNFYTHEEKSEYVKKAFDEILNAIDINGVKPEEIEALVRGKDAAEHGAKALYFIRPNAKQIQDGLDWNWELSDVIKGYTIGENGECSKGELSVMKIDDMQLFDSDLEAAEQVEKDGVKLIPKKELHFGRGNNMKYYRYIDTPENRKLLAEYLSKEKKIENPVRLFADKKTGNWMLVRENTVQGMDFGWRVALFDSDRKFIRESVFDEKSPEDAVKSAGDVYKKAKLWSPESVHPYNAENHDPQGLGTDGKDELEKQADDFFDILQKDGRNEQSAKILANSFETLSSKPDVWNFLINKEHALIKKALYVATGDAFLGDNLRWLIENGPDEQWREIRANKKFCEEILANAENSITNDSEYSINPTLELAEKIGMADHALDFCKKLYEEIPAESTQKKQDFMEKINAFKKDYEKHVVKDFFNRLSASHVYPPDMTADKYMLASANFVRKNYLSSEERKIIDKFISKSGVKSEKELADFLKKHIEPKKNIKRGKEKDIGIER